MIGVPALFSVYELYLDLYFSGTLSQCVVAGTIATTPLRPGPRAGSFLILLAICRAMAPPAEPPIV